MREVTGPAKLNGPFVTRTGFTILFPSSRHRSLLPPLSDWKTKYLPSPVQIPQHSEEGFVQLLRTGRNDRPSLLVSQKPRVWSTGSMRVNQRIFPSGDQRSQKARPGSVAKGVHVPSSSLLMNNQFPAAYRT